MDNIIFIHVFSFYIYEGLEETASADGGKCHFIQSSRQIWHQSCPLAEVDAHPAINLNVVGRSEFQSIDVARITDSKRKGEVQYKVFAQRKK
ncbi:hypothetical protein A7K69_14280 [Parageobacillus thermoglucosidasius]|uniref:Uncharacterized protein n=1 Tax=Parageobacillus thermoglucosidasius TaxID=1426 RepID=A0A1B7KN91_PARTM|nr:hypothetical protein A7K69_14280 [Parageobacillus thermoglucosidasius]